MKSYDDSDMDAFQLFYTLIVAKFTSEKFSDVCSFPVVNKVLREISARCFSDPNVGKAVARYLDTDVPHNVAVLVAPMIKRQLHFENAVKNQRHRTVEIFQELCFPYKTSHLSIEDISKYIDQTTTG